MPNTADLNCLDPVPVQEASTSPVWVEGGSSSCSHHIPLALPAGSSSISASPPWVLINPARYGFYRTNYSEAMWNQLTAAAADSKVVPSADMAGDSHVWEMQLGAVMLSLLLTSHAGVQEQCAFHGNA